MIRTALLLLGTALLLMAAGTPRERPRPPAPRAEGSAAGSPASPRSGPAAVAAPPPDAPPLPTLAAAPAPDAPATIHGTVVDDRGAPVAGVRVAVEGSDGELAAESDGAGRVTLPPIPGGWGGGDALCLEHPEHARTRFDLPAGAAAGREPFEVVLPRGAVLRGLVVDEKGEPIAGAVVKAGTASKWQSLFGWQVVPDRCVLTGLRGEYELRGLPAEPIRPLVYREADPGRDSIPWVGPEVRGRPGEATEAGRLVTRPPGAIRGRVVDRFGRPAAGLRIQAIPEPCGMYSGVAERSVETGEDGTFAFPDLPPGGYLLGRRPFGIHNDLGRLGEVVVAPGSVADVEVVHPPRR